MFEYLISVAQLKSLLAQRRVVVFDCRFSLADPAWGNDCFIRGHIPAAIYADLNRDLSSPIDACSGRHPLPDVTLLAQKFSQWGVGADTQVVVYDQGDGSIAARLWWLLRWLGHDGVALLDGGFKAWQQAGESISADRAQCAAQPFEIHLKDNDWVSSEALLKNLEKPDCVLLDARSKVRFDGVEEPIDSVAGHVPGALNYPYTENLRSDGAMLGRAELRDKISSLLGSSQTKSCIHMCGSGVTACLNMLAMEYAGFGRQILYAGSWSEWIRDPDRPVQV